MHPNFPRAIISALLTVTAIVPTKLTAAAFINGSFETSTTGTATGWTVTHGPGGVNDLTFSTPGATNGTKSAQFNPFQLTGAAILSQSFDTVAGQTYTVTLNFGAFGTLTGYTQQLLVEVRDGASFSTGTQLINAGTGCLVAGANTGISLTQASSQISLFDTTGTNNIAYVTPVPTSPQFSYASFTFTAQSATSTLVFSDKTSATGQFTDGTLDNINVVKSSSGTAAPATVYPAVELVWNSISGKTYQVQTKAFIECPNWSDFGSPIPGDGTEKTVFDKTRDASRRFYRVIELP